MMRDTYTALHPRNQKSAQPHLWVYATRQITALTLIGAMLMIPTPPALAHPVAVNATVQSGLGNNFLSVVLANLLALFGTAQEAGQDPGMPPTGESPQLIEPESPPSQIELEARVVRLEMNPKGEAKIELGQLLVMSAIPLDSEGNPIQGLIPTWESSDSSIISVTGDGQAKGAQTGVARLTARAGSQQESVSVTVIESADSSSVAQERSTGKGTKSVLNARNAITKDSRFFHANIKHVGAASRAHATSFTKARASLKPAAVIIDDSDTAPANELGTSPGRKELGAATPPAAISGTESPGSANFTFNVPVVSLPGRGLDVALSLIYNSRLWHKQSGGNLEYDRDKNWLAPGFRLGFGHLETYDTLWPAQNYIYMITDADGAHHSVANGNAISQDGSFISFQSTSTGGVATYTDGTRVEYGSYKDVGPSGLPGQVRHSYPIKITDRNGNYILISYVGGAGPRINSIQDTLGRYVYFKYQGNDLVTITVPGYAGGVARQALRFYYQDISINPAGSFSVNASPAGPITKRVLRYVYDPGTRSGYRYDYSTPYGMITRINQLRGMTVSTTDPLLVGSVTSEGQVAAWTEYNYPTTPASLEVTSLSGAVKLISTVTQTGARTGTA